MKQNGHQESLLTQETTSLMVEKNYFEPSPNPGVRYHVDGSIAVIIIERPSHMNALSMDIVFSLFTIFKSLEDDASISFIIIRGSDRFFSTGGDIKQVFENYKEKKFLNLESFFKMEYGLINKIAQSKKAISLVSGYAYGAGLAVALSCQHSYFKESTKVAAPEMKLSFFPDAGLAYWLNKTDKKFPGFAFYAGLCGENISPCDLYNAGTIKGVLNDVSVLTVEKTIIQSQPKTTGDLDKALSTYLEPARISSAQNLIEKLSTFRKIHSVEDFINMNTHQVSDLSLWTIYHHLLNTRDKTLRDVLSIDLRLTSFFITASNFFEGIRITIIDKGSLPNFVDDLTKDNQKRILSFYENLQ